MSNMVTRAEGNRSHVAPTWMSRKEVCEHLSITPRVLRGMTKTGAIERRFTNERALYRSRISPDDATRGDVQRAPRIIDRPAPEVLDLRPIHVTSQTAQSQSDIEVVGTSKAEVEEAARMVQVAKLALRQRDRALTKRLEIEKERDALRERLVRVESAVERSQQQRDRYKEQRNRARRQRDLSTVQLDRAIAQRDCAIEQRDGLLERIDRALDQRDRAMEQFKTSYEMLQSWQSWHKHAQETLDDYKQCSERATQLTASALSTPWWAFSRRKSIERQIKDLTEQ